jgi:hypothetical protein
VVKLARHTLGRCAAGVDRAGAMHTRSETRRGGGGGGGGGGSGSVSSEASLPSGGSDSRGKRKCHPTDANLVGRTGGGDGGRDGDRDGDRDTDGGGSGGEAPGGGGENAAGLLDWLLREKPDVGDAFEDVMPLLEEEVVASYARAAARAAKPPGDGGAASTTAPVTVAPSSRTFTRTTLGRVYSLPNLFPLNIQLQP